MRPNSPALALTACFLLSCPAFGWWETGHRTIARIAANHLTPGARVRVSRILSVPDTPEAIAEELAKISTWADEVKSETQTGEWHYVDLTLQDTKAQIPLRCEKDNCAPARIRLFAAQLAAGKSRDPRQPDRWSELEALKFLVHFVGDIHQPLHAISDEDAGGNCEKLDPPIENAKNLHGLWDGGILRTMGDDDKVLAGNLESYIAKLDADTRSAWAGGKADDWTWESHTIAQQNIYSKLHIPTEPIGFPKGCSEAPAEILEFRPAVDSLYIDSMKPVVRDQLAKAGLRLASLLNESL